MVDSHGLNGVSQGVQGSGQLSLPFLLVSQPIFTVNFGRLENKQGLIATQLSVLEALVNSSLVLRS